MTDILGNEVAVGDYIAIAQCQTKGGSPSLGIAQISDIYVGSKSGFVRIFYTPLDNCVSTPGNYISSKYKFIKINYKQQ